MPYLLNQFCIAHEHAGEPDLYVEVLGRGHACLLLTLDIIEHSVLDRAPNLRAAFLHVFPYGFHAADVVGKEDRIDTLLAQPDVYEYQQGQLLLLLFELGFAVLLQLAQLFNLLILRQSMRGLVILAVLIHQ